jgi:hypothetical protein
MAGSNAEAKKRTGKNHKKEHRQKLIKDIFLTILIKQWNL